MRAQTRRYSFDLAASEKRSRFWGTDVRCSTIDDIDADGFGKSCGFGESCFNIARAARPAIGIHNHRPSTAAQAFFPLKFKTTQDAVLFPIVRAFFGKVERMCGLHR